MHKYTSEIKLSAGLHSGETSNMLIRPLFLVTVSGMRSYSAVTLPFETGVTDSTKLLRGSQPKINLEEI